MWLIGRTAERHSDGTDASVADVLAGVDLIAAADAATLAGLFRERVHRSPDSVAYRYFDPSAGAWRDLTWSGTERKVARWQAAFEREGLRRGDRVAVMLRNCPEWVIFDQAALGLGLVVVPLHYEDRPENAAYILQDAGVKLLLVDCAASWNALAGQELSALQRVVCLGPVPAGDARLRDVADWLPAQGGAVRDQPGASDDLATLIYTSGTTGRPKGVMLSHRNILSNAAGCLACATVTRNDVCLSFLPLSHSFERTVGYYAMMMAGATVAFARSVPLLAEDLLTVRPTVLVSVPRIFERIHGALQARLDAGRPAARRLFDLAVRIGWERFEHAQGRAKERPEHLLWPVLERLVAKKVLARLGGRVRCAISGGAPLSPAIARVFIALGLPLIQGFGLTEASPVVCVNRPGDNDPASVGKPLPEVQVRLDEQGVLQVKGPNVMLGYWNNPDATRRVLSPDGWLDTGDIARIDGAGRIYITGRAKDVLVMSNGEKISPSEVEAAITHDPLFEQVLLVGEGRPYLGLLAVLNKAQWSKAALEAGLDPESLRSPEAEQLVLGRVARQLCAFPVYAQVRRAVPTLEPWTTEGGLLTPTMKLRRAQVTVRFAEDVAELYRGH